MRRPSAKALAKACSLWNKRNNAGCAVEYWTGLREGEPKTGATFTEAQVLGGHTAGVYIAGAGFVALSHVRSVSS